MALIFKLAVAAGCAVAARALLRQQNSHVLTREDERLGAVLVNLRDEELELVPVDEEDEIIVVTPSGETSLLGDRDPIQVVLGGENPGSRVESKRGRRKSSRLTIAADAAAFAVSIVGRLKDTAANRLVLSKVVRDYLQEKKVRPATIARNFGLAVELALVPTEGEIEGQKLKASRAVERRHQDMEEYIGRAHASWAQKLFGGVFGRKFVRAAIE
jgi:hypothetical protein